MKKGIRSGQALVEYALILVLVALVVIVIISVLGPSVRDVFAQVASSASSAGAAPTAAPLPTPTPTPEPAWTWCAEEHDYCAFTGTHQVRYGENGTYIIKTFTGGTWCSNAVFTDPLYLTFKHCDYK